MDTRIPIVIVIVLGSILFRNNMKGRGHYITVVSILLILESCLRSMFIGPDDTWNYYNMFITYKDISKFDVVNIFLDGYVHMQMYAKDPGFIVLVYLFHLISDNYQFFLFFTACIYFIPLGIVIYRNTSNNLDICFSYILHMALFHVIALCCIRQQIATGLGFIVFLSIINRKYFLAILTFLIGFTIHKSLVLIVLPLLLVVFFKERLKQIHAISLSLVPFIVILANRIVGFMGGLTGNDYYLGYADKEGSGYTFLALAELCSFFSLITISKVDFNSFSFRQKYLYSMLPMLSIFVPLIVVDGTMIRVSQYFTLYLVVIIPMAIAYSKRFFYGFNLLKIANLVLIVLMFMQKFEYHFFWESIRNPY